MTKKLILSSLVCALFHVHANAQVEKGTGYFGATMSLTGRNAKSPDYGNFKSNQFGINPSIQFGKFIKTNRMIGIGLGTSNNFSSSSSDPGNEKIKFSQNEYYISPYLRQYKTIGSKWAVFLTTFAKVSLLQNTAKSIGNNDSESGFSAGIGLKPGVSYWITPKFALESDINLLSVGAGYTSFADTDKFYFRSGVTTNLDGYFSVRASWYFNKQ